MRGPRAPAIRTPKRSKGGYSGIGTLILFSTTLVVTVAAAFAAYGILEAQSQVAEYENARSALVMVAELIEGVSQSEGAAGYSRIYVRSGSLDLASGETNFALMIGSWNAIKALSFTNVRFRAGRLVGGPDYSVLRGQTGQTSQPPLVILPSTPEIPLGWVYVKQEDGTCVIVDFGRVRVTLVGPLNLSSAEGGWEPVNVVEVEFIRLVRGPTYGRGVFDIRVQNENITVTSTKLQGTSFQVLAVRGSSSGTFTLNCPTSMNGVPIRSTIFNVIVIEVEVGTQ